AGQQQHGAGLRNGLHVDPILERVQRRRSELETNRVRVEIDAVADRATSDRGREVRVGRGQAHRTDASAPRKLDQVELEQEAAEDVDAAEDRKVIGEVDIDEDIARLNVDR